MRTDALLDDLRAKNISVYLKDGKVKVKGNTQLLTDDFISELRNRKTEIFEYLTNFQNKGETVKQKNNVQETVNQFIARGVVFYPNENDCSIENSELLNADEKEFLGANQTEILYLLQFASIWKYAPEHFPTLQKQVAENPDSLYETVKSCFALCFSENEDTEQGNKQNEVI